MQAEIRLKRTKEGTPKRLLLFCGRGQRDEAHIAGRGTGSYNKSIGAWSYPVDPSILRALLTHFPGALVSKDAMDYMKELKDRQSILFQALNDGSPLEKNDRLRGSTQRASVRFLEQGKRVALTHEMGLGKTVIASYALRHLKCNKVLVVCPNAVIKESWVKHIKEWTGDIPLYQVEILTKKAAEEARKEFGVTVIRGSRKERHASLAELLIHKERLVLLVNYEQMTIHQDILSAHEWDCFILDEAHRVKNRQAKRTRAAFEIAPKAYYVWPLTGTPWRRCPSDLWALLHLLDPDRFMGFWNFVYTYLLSYPAQYGIEIVGVRDKNEFAAMLSPYMFGRTKAEALPDLPDKIFIEHKLPMNEKQARAYRGMEEKLILDIKKELEDGKTIDSILKAPTAIAQYTRLRQICLNPAILDGVDDSAKLDFLSDLFEDMGKEKFLVFTRFRKFIPYLTPILDNLEVPYSVVVGGQPHSEQVGIESKLNEGKIQAVVGTIAGPMGEGMNLQSASAAIFCDIEPVPAINAQCEDRIHRPGIKTSPTIIHLYHPGTVEEDIRKIAVKRGSLINATVGQVEAMRALIERRS